MGRVFTAADGLVPVDLAHCAVDHLTAAKTLFESDPSHYDSAGYLAHIGVELLIKAWLLEVDGKFAGTHFLKPLYEKLERDHDAPHLSVDQVALLVTLDRYEQLRYPNRNGATEVGNDTWLEIELFIGFLCRSMPREIDDALGKVEPGHKAGRRLMRKPVAIDEEPNPTFQRPAAPPLN